MQKFHVTQELKRLRNHSGLSMGEVAKALGYRNASSYQRYEDPVLFKDAHLPLKLVKKIIPIFVGRGEPPITERQILDLAGPIPTSDAKDLLAVEGMVAAGLFQELDDIQQDVRGYVPVSADGRYPGRHQYALEVIGESMNIVLPNGSFAIVMKNSNREQPRQNDLVVVRRHREGGMVERTVKRVRRITNGYELVPESRDDSFKSIVLAGDSDSTVEIEGFVIGLYMPL